jgi:RpiB/LacA/LacB family sugar-phosphate isomerase
MKKKIIYASDYRGIDLRKALVHKHTLSTYGFEDLGIDDGSLLDYVDISKKLAERLRNTEDIGVMICGSGQGVAIALNRFTHIRAAMCRNIEDVVQVREKLNANVLCLGSKNSSLDEALLMIEAFSKQSFKNEKHASCVEKLLVNQTAHLDKGINLIVRAIIIQDGHVLLTTATKENKNFSSDLFFMPGGHVEYNESAITALKREIWEEMHLIVKKEEFRGLLECSWDRKGKLYHELNLVFKVEIEGLNILKAPEAMDHKFHQFVWKPLDEVQNISLLPDGLKTIILSSPAKQIKYQSEMTERG